MALRCPSQKPGAPSIAQRWVGEKQARTTPQGPGAPSSTRSPIARQGGVSFAEANDRLPPAPLNHDERKPANTPKPRHLDRSSGQSPTVRCERRDPCIAFAGRQRHHPDLPRALQQAKEGNPGGKGTTSVVPQNPHITPPIPSGDPRRLTAWVLDEGSTDILPSPEYCNPQHPKQHEPYKSYLGSRNETAPENRCRPPPSCKPP